MTVLSMTGYGRAQEEHDGWRLQVEIRSVNHRGLDVRVHCPAQLAPTEPLVRRQIKARCARGRVECRLTLAVPTTDVAPKATLQESQRLFDSLTAIAQHLGLKKSITLNELLQAGLNPLFPGETESLEGFDATVTTAVSKALDKLLETRHTEGEFLQKFYVECLKRVEGLLESINKDSLSFSQHLKQRIATKVEELIRELAPDKDLDDSRLVQEIAHYVDRSDITEEVVRARSHRTALSQIFSEDAQEQGPVGKRVDFFLQELNREANTMASKSASAELTALVVDLKVEVERMREQAHNIE